MSGKKNFPRRGDVYWVNLEPAIGAEIKKTRPGLIVSNDIGNEVSKLVTIAPITSKVKNIYPFEVKVILDKKYGKIMLNQCRAVDKSRLKNRIDSVEPGTMKEVEEAIKIAFGLS